jgi:hypothetical protein
MRAWIPSGRFSTRSERVFAKWATGALSMLGLAALAYVAAPACAAKNADEGSFQCATDDDCGSTWRCALAPGAKIGTCGKPCNLDSECEAKKACVRHVPPLDASDTMGLCLVQRCNPRPEICDGVDNNCDGSIDEGSDLCPNAGTSCRGGVCAEDICDDGVDNDHDGYTDCNDDSCTGRSCGGGKICAGGVCPP